MSSTADVVPSPVMSSCAVAARAIITCPTLDVVECVIRRAYVRRWGSEFAGIMSVSDNSPRRSVRTISFNKTLPSFVSLIYSTSQLDSIADSGLFLLLQRHRQACVKLAGCCCLNRRIELTSSVYRGVPNWRQGPGKWSTQLHRAQLQLLHTFCRPSPAEMFTWRASPRLFAKVS